MSERFTPAQALEIITEAERIGGRTVVVHVENKPGAKAEMLMALREHQVGRSYWLFDDLFATASEFLTKWPTPTATLIETVVFGRDVYVDPRQPVVFLVSPGELYNIDNPSGRRLSSVIANRCIHVHVAA